MTAQAISAVLARLEAGTCDTRAAAGLTAERDRFAVTVVNLAGQRDAAMARAEQAEARVAALEAHPAAAQAEMERALPILQKYLKHPNDQHDMEEFRKAAKGKSE